MSELSPEQRARLDQATRLHEAGQITAARDIYVQLLGQAPNHAQTLHLLGLAGHQMGSREDSLVLFDRSLELAPSQADAWVNRGNLLLDLQRLEEALASYDHALKLNPKFADAWFSRGIALTAMKRHAEALEAYDRALALRPNDPGAWGNRGIVLHEMGRGDEAIASYDRALALAPDFFEALINRGNALMLATRREEALASYERAAHAQPNNPMAHHMRAAALRDLQRYGEALTAYDQAIRLQPDFADAHTYRGLVLHELGRVDEAVASYDRALAIQPGAVLALLNRGRAGLSLDRHAQAAADYESAMAIDPALTDAGSYALHARMQVCDWDGFDERLDALVAGIDGGDKIAPPLVLQALTDRPGLLRRAAERFIAQSFPGRTTDMLTAVHRDRIRIGYVSSDFGDHPVAHLLTGVLEHHDRSRFEIYAFSLSKQPDTASRRRIEAAVDHFIELGQIPDADAIRVVRGHGIDIAVDLNGMTRDCRPDLFIRRVAPIQVNYLGYAGTIGGDFVDYIVADPILVPDEQRDYYCEKTALVSHYQINDDKVAVPAHSFSRAELGLPENGFVFCAFNQAYKILPDVFDRWLRILDRVPGSVLWLSVKGQAADNLRARAKAQGIDPERLVFAPRMAEMADHLARHRAADLFLDTHPYNAMATASAALRMGVPVLTRLGQSFAARMGASLLEAVGLPELIAETPDAYEDLAVAFATQPERLAAIREKLARNLPGCALFDTKGATRQLEDLYGRMHARAESGLAPGHIGLASAPAEVKLATLTSFISEQREIFTALRPRSRELYAKAKLAWRDGVPMHWMSDWAAPFPLFVKFSFEANITDIDEITYDDFCLGDTPAMFGHARPELTHALTEQAKKGIAYMLPIEAAIAVGEGLKSRFGMDQWQVCATASDANRAAIRWARAVTGRTQILVFDGCYHGMVDDCHVTLQEGLPVNKPGLIGQIVDQTQTTCVIPFNDVAALETALKSGQVAAVLAEPVMTNCGMIKPDDLFHKRLRDLTQRYGTLLILDETHTLSTGPGGYTGAFGLIPDVLVIGKAIAGGIAAAVWGVTAEMAARMDVAQAQIGPGQSGIGTTLSGNALAMTAIHTMLTEVMTDEAYHHMLMQAAGLFGALSGIIIKHDLPWCIVNVGARLELVFAPERPRNAEEMRRYLDRDLLEAFHLYLINRGLLIAPFHNMMLISPQTTGAAIDRLVAAIEDFALLQKDLT